MDKDAVRAIVREIAGEERAAIMAEAEKMIDSLEKKFGSAAQARAQGINTNFLEREGLAPAKAAPSHKAGRFMRALAATRGDVGLAQREAKDRGDTALAEMCERAIAERKQKAMAYSDFTAGGALVPEEFSNEVIGLLYPALTVSSLGANVVPMPNGNLTLPFLDTGVTAYYVGEVSNITPSQQTTGQIQLTAKKLAAVVPISNDLLRTPSAKADAFVQGDMISRLAVRGDQAFYRGTGASGQPKGVRNWAIADNEFAQSGTALANKVADLGKLQRLIQEQNVPMVGGGYILSPRTEWALKTTLDSLGNFIFLKAMEAGMLMGYAYRSSTSVPNTLSTDKSEIVFGAFGHVVIGDSEQIEVSVHPDGAFFDGSSVQSGVNLDCTPMRAIARHDLACRYRGKEIAVQTGTSWA